MKEGVLAYGPSGGTGGEPVTLPWPAQSRSVVIRVRADDVVHALGFGRTGELAGGPGGELQEVRLEEGERLVRIGGRSGAWIDSLVLTTSSGRELRFGGTGGESDFSYPVPDGFVLRALSLRCGTYLDALGVVLARSKPAPKADQAASVKRQAPGRAAGKTAPKTAD